MTKSMELSPIMSNYRYVRMTKIQNGQSFSPKIAKIEHNFLLVYATDMISVSSSIFDMRNSKEPFFLMIHDHRSI